MIVSVHFRTEDLNLEQVFVSGWGFLMDKQCTTIDQGPAIYAVSGYDCSLLWLAYGRWTAQILGKKM